MKIRLPSDISFRLVFYFVCAEITSGAILCLIYCALHAFGAAKNTDGLMTILLWGIPFVILVALFFALYSLGLHRRLKRFKEYVDRVSEGDYSRRDQPSGHDEIAQITQSIERMVMALQESFEKQKADERAKTEIISSISHDLKTPITAITGYSDLIRTNIYTNPAACEEYTDIMSQTCQIMRRQINQMLEYCRLQYKEIILDTQLIRLYDLVSQVLIDFIPRLEKEGIAFSIVQVHENLHVRVDVKLFIRMLQNLIQNGIQYGKSGKRIVIELDRVVTVIKIRVINFGEKIGEEDLPNLFERFYRAEKSRSSYAGGMGMGLAIAKSIAELHGGTIQVESDDNRTFFEIILPDSLA